MAMLAAMPKGGGKKSRKHGKSRKRKHGKRRHRSKKK